MIATVVICTHNPRVDFIERCLAALRGQTLPPSQWKLLIVDNRSSEPLEGRIDVSWHPFAKVIREERLGLTPARLRAIREVETELLIFVDDDNVLDADFLTVAADVSETKPFIGSWSGQCRPGFEEKPAEWTRRYWGNLVIREFESDLWSNLPRLPQTMPCGAGLCVRKDVARHYLFLHDSGRRAFQLDRSGDSLTSGGDNDLAACACDIGLGVGLIADMKLTHLIRKERVTPDYLERLCEGIFFSAVVLAYLRASPDGLAAYAIRWHEPLRAMLTSGPHRRIQLACLRGRRRGLKYIASLAD